MYQQSVPRPPGLSDAEWASRANEAYDGIVQDTPVRTGHLRSSWSKNVLPDRLDVKNTADYAPYVFDGTSRQSPQDVVQTARDFLSQHGLF